MADIISYVRGCRETFAERPLGRADSLVLSCLAYLWLPEEVPAARTEAGVALMELDTPEPRLSLTAPVGNHEAHERLLAAVASSPRFFNVRVCLAEQESDAQAEQQFAAVTFLLPGGGAYVAFRGTDNTLLGWKEDLNMAFLPTVPAQEAARTYLGRVAAQVEGPLWVGGHSKGGNLAVFATMTCEGQVRARVVRCLSHDGPGFTTATTADARWSGAWGLADKTVPGESLVGLLLGADGCEPTVVMSTRASILQHDPFSWVVEGDDLAPAPALSYDAYRMGRRLNAWLAGMGADERGRFVDILWRVVRASGEVTFSGLAGSLADGSLALMLRRLDGLPEADRAFFLGAVGELAATLILGPAPVVPQTAEERATAAAERVDDITARFNDTLARWEKYLG